MRSKQISRLLLMLIILLMANLANKAVAQGICIPEPLKVTAVCGQVVLPSKKGEEPLQGAKIELREKDYEGRTIATVTADESGCFNFSGIQPGKYVLRASYPDLMQFMIRVQVVKAPKAKESQCHILIALGANALEPCGGGFAKVRPSLQSCVSK